MWVYCESCFGYKLATVLIDHAARRTICSECGHEIKDGVDVAENETVRVADPINPEPKNDSSVDILYRFLRNSQNLESDSVSFATSQPQTASSDDVAEIETVRVADPINPEPKIDSSVDLLSGFAGYSQDNSSDSVSVATSQPQNRSSDDFLNLTLGNSQTLRRQDTVIANMSQRLGLPATVENKANGIFKKIEHYSKGSERPDLSAACIFIACRDVNDQTRSLAEIVSVANGFTTSDIREAIEFIATMLRIDKNQLLQVKAVDLIKRFCSKLGMNSEAVKVAEEAAGDYDVIDTSVKDPESVAAAVLYVIDQLSYENKLFKDIIDVTGVTESRLKAAYEVVYSYRSALIPNWFANAIDLMNLASP